MENLKIILIGIIIIVAIYYGGSAFIGLMSDIYHLLDNYIWAFFAGIIAFFATISIVGIMIQITVFFVALFFGGILALVALLER